MNFSLLDFSLITDLRCHGSVDMAAYVDGMVKVELDLNILREGKRLNEMILREFSNQGYGNQIWIP